MKRILPILLLVCLLSVSCCAAAEGCILCGGNRKCDTCDSLGYVTMQLFQSTETAQVVCPSGCDHGFCPSCVLPCAVCNSDGYCNTCSGVGYLTATEYGSGKTVHIVCSNPLCHDGKCIACAQLIPGDVHLSFTAQGLGPMDIVILLHKDGKISFFDVVNHCETPGFGADFINSGFDYLIGKNISTAQIVDVVSGCTSTADGLRSALNTAAQHLGIQRIPCMLNTYDVFGFQPMKVTIALDESGRIVSFNVIKHNETPGFGADVIAEGFDHLLGQDVKSAKIDTVSGVTFTRNALNDALKAAAVDFFTANTNAISYDVTGFYPMTVAIALDESGCIQFFDVIKHNEIPGLGADVIAKGFDFLIGQDVKSAKIDTVSGVTFTCNALNDALKAAAADFFTAYTNATSYDVTGFYPMTVAIALDESGRIQFFDVIEHNEIPGFGADIIAKGFDHLLGQNIADARIDITAGATFTSNALNDALKAAANDFASP